MTIHVSVDQIVGIILLVLGAIYLFLVKRENPERFKHSVVMVLIYGIFAIQLIPIAISCIVIAITNNQLLHLLYPIGIFGALLLLILTMIQTDFQLTSTKFQINKMKKVIGCVVIISVLIIPIQTAINTYANFNDNETLWFVIKNLLIVSLVAVVAYLVVAKCGKARKKIQPGQKEGETHEHK